MTAPLHLSTFSIVARDETGVLGVAVTSRVLAVGAHCPFVSERSVAIASQAYLNPYLAYDLMERVDAGAELDEAAEAVLAADPGRAWRQVIAIRPAGDPFAFTGSETDPWSGHRVGEHSVAAGNLLVGADTVTALSETFEGSAGALPERLIRALASGQAAGGDRRGRQSAAILVRASEAAPLVDLRVDDHPDPVAELARLYELLAPDLERALRRATTREPAAVAELRARQADVRAQLQSEGR